MTFQNDIALPINTELIYNLKAPLNNWIRLSVSHVGKYSSRIEVTFDKIENDS